MQSEKYFYTLEPGQGSFTVTEKVSLDGLKSLRAEIIEKTPEVAFLYKRIIDILEGEADNLGMVSQGAGTNTGKKIVLPHELEQGDVILLTLPISEAANDN